MVSSCVANQIASSCLGGWSRVIMTPASLVCNKSCLERLSSFSQPLCPTHGGYSSVMGLVLQLRVRPQQLPQCPFACLVCVDPVLIHEVICGSQQLVDGLIGQIVDPYIVLSNLRLQGSISLVLDGLDGQILQILHRHNATPLTNRSVVLNRQHTDTRVFVPEHDCSIRMRSRWAVLVVSDDRAAR